jgi:tetratricopeptide (TPR) repeat protein
MEFEFNVYNYNKGAEAFKEKKYEESIIFYTKAMEDNPLMNFTQAFFWRGLSYFFLNKFQAAINDFDKASYGFSEDFRLFHWRGLCFSQLEEFQKAIDDFQKSISLNHDFIDSYIQLYECYVIIENHNLSDEILDKIIEINPQNLMKIIMCGNKNYEKNYCEIAIKIFSDILKRAPDEPNSLQGRAFCYGNMSNFGYAMKDLNRLIDLNQESGNPYFNRGITYRQMKEDEKANADFKKAYELGLKHALDFIK